MMVLEKEAGAGQHWASGCPVGLKSLQEKEQDYLTRSCHLFLSPVPPLRDHEEGEQVATALWFSPTYKNHRPVHILASLALL